MTSSFTNKEKSYYLRHFDLKEIGPDGQLRLKNASVLCVGAGGLGSPSLLYLASAGVGEIGICEYDDVDRSNLQRQVLYGDYQVGDPKVDCAEKRLKELNPYIQINCHNQKLSTENALILFEKYDLILDCTDNFPARYLINDACEILNKPYIYGSISSFEGQVSVFNFEDGPTYRDLYPHPPDPDSVPSCSEAGVLGVLPGVIGTLQATEALKIILKIGTSLSGRLLIFDALGMKFREFSVSKNSQREKVTQLSNIHENCLNKNFHGILQISPSKLRDKINKGWRPFVIDVRNPHEIEMDGKFDWVDLNHPFDELQNVMESIPGDKEVVVYCSTGKRSQLAARTLMKSGSLKVFNLEGGYRALR